MAAAGNDRHGPWFERCVAMRGGGGADGGVGAESAGPVSRAGPGADAILGEFSGSRCACTCRCSPRIGTAMPTEYDRPLLRDQTTAARSARAGLANVQVDFFPAADEWTPRMGTVAGATGRKKLTASRRCRRRRQGSSSADVEATSSMAGPAARRTTPARTWPARSSSARRRGPAVQRGVNARGRRRDRHGQRGVSATPRASRSTRWLSSVSPRTHRQGGSGSGVVRADDRAAGLRGPGPADRDAAHVKARRRPGKMNVVSAVISGLGSGRRRTAERWRTPSRPSRPGANDNCAGWEPRWRSARSLARLIRDGVLAGPRRTLSFPVGCGDLGVAGLHVRPPGTRGPAARRDELRHAGHDSREDRLLPAI